MATCSIENCKDECFEQEDKCILHCEKNEKNDWYSLDENNKKTWNDSKVIHSLSKAKHKEKVSE
ncbi:MAG: hypothetical protein QG567_2476 [Campylobacterota bacterium]|nr:hypothetical protein [Campylobacterota bacterium]MDQ1341318.1 hypothetical protein [Campylobacterota bacterium]